MTAALSRRRLSERLAFVTAVGITAAAAVIGVLLLGGVRPAGTTARLDSAPPPVVVATVPDRHGEPPRTEAAPDTAIEAVAQRERAPSEPASAEPGGNSGQSGQNGQDGQGGYGGGSGQGKKGKKSGRG